MGVDCRVSSTHPEDLQDGRVFGPGDLATDVDLNEPHNQRLVDEGRLIPLEKPTEKKLTGQVLDDRGKELGIDGFAGMTADEKRGAIQKAEQDPPDPDDDKEASE